MRKIIQIGLILAGIGMASYPWISNSLYEKEAGSRIQVYEKKSRELPKKNYQNLMREARDYNANLAKADVILTDPFSSEQSKKNTGKDYREILHIPGSEVMAYVDIPGIRIYLPVYHGTDGEVLEKGIGHLGATSVPVGGTLPGIQDWIKQNYLQIWKRSEKKISFIFMCWEKSWHMKWTIFLLYVPMIRRNCMCRESKIW